MALATPAATYVFGFGGSGSSAGHLSAPAGLTADPEGNVWVADTAHNRIQEFGPEGEFVRQFGAKGSGNGLLSEPGGIAVDAEGNLWVADTGNDRVQEFDSTGTYLRQFGSAGSGEGQLSEPQSIALDPEGHIWVADTANSRIEEFSPEGTYLRKFGTKGTSNGQLKEPEGIALDPEGHIWVADTGNHRVEEFSPEGTYLSKFGKNGTANGQFNFPAGIATDAEGNLWVADTGNGRIQEFNSEGKYLSQLGSPGNEAGQLSAPQGVSPDAEGNVWVADTGNDRIQEFAASEFVLEAGGEGSGAGRLSSPNETATDSEGNVWVADTGHDRVQEFDSEGEFIRQFGAGGEGDGQLSEPGGIAVGPEGNVWVADTGNHRVQEFSPEGEYLSQFGTVGSENGKFRWLRGLAFDSEGHIWVLDENPYLARVQEFTPEGKFLSTFGSLGTANGQFEAPQGIAIDAEDHIWVADTGNNRVQEFNLGGEFIRKAGSEGTENGQFKAPAGLTADAEGNLWVADTGHDRVQEFDSEGEFVRQFGAKGEGDGQFEEPQGIAVDPEGNVWVADSGNYRIQKFDSEGKFLLAFGEKGTGSSQFNELSDVTVDPEGDVLALDRSLVKRFDSEGKFIEKFNNGKGFGDGELEEPRGLALDAEDHIWVADTGNDRVQEFSSTGKFLGKFGEEGSGTGHLDAPSSLAIDAEGNVWVADTGNNRVEKFDAEGIYLSQFGTPGNNAGQLSEPQGIAIDPEGNIWVADTENDRVEKWRPNRPEVTDVSATSIKDTQATLNAIVNPEGSTTQYFFEYGLTTSYGSVVPPSPESIGSGTEGVKVFQAITELEPHATYHFRVVANNDQGTTVGKDHLFIATDPPQCQDEESTTLTVQPRELTLECSGYGELTYEVTSPPEHGATSELDPVAGTITYTSEAEFTGTDTFRFTAFNAGGKSSSATATINVCSPPEIEASGEATEPETPGVGLWVNAALSDTPCQEGGEEPYVAEFQIYIDEELVFTEERECENSETESCNGDFARGLQLPYAKVIGTHDYRVEAVDQLGFEADATDWTKTTPEEGTIFQIPPEAEDSATSEGCKTPKNRYKHYVFKGKVVYGTPCADIMGRYPGHNTKVYKAGAGNDVIRAGGEINGIYGGAGDDRIYAGRGNDKVFGGAGDDQIVGGSGDDTIVGNSGNDNLMGSTGADYIRGGIGDDLIEGGGTADRLYGDAGTNTLIFAGGVIPGFEFGNFLSGFPSSSLGRGVYVNLSETPIEDNKGEKYIRAFNGYTARFGGGTDRLYIDSGSFQNVIGSPFADVIIGSDKANLIDGGGGPDIIEGAGGDDQLFGGADSDLLDGGEGQGVGNLHGGEGSDICINGTESAQSCERESTEEGLKPISSEKIEVGRLNPDDSAYDTEIYLRGSEGSDNVTATWDGKGEVVHFVAYGESGTGRFDTTANEVSGCSVSETEAACPLNGVHTLLMDGGKGNDVLKASKFPAAISVTVLGGDGRDVLRGGDTSEDILVDGPGTGKDDLYGFGDDDTFFANEGRDRLYGAGGSDLFVSSWPCEDRIFGGGDAWDNASWAQIRGEQIEESGLFKKPVKGADVSLPLKPGESGTIGRFGVGCEKTKEEDGTIKGVEFLEGSSGEDRLEGDNAHNVILGRNGKDRLIGLGGKDNLLANNRDPNGETEEEKHDPDENLNCGGGEDTLLYDWPYDQEAIQENCENVEHGKGTQWSQVSGIGSEPTAEASSSAVDEDVIGAASDPEALQPSSFFRFDETSGTLAKNWIYEEENEELGAGTYEGGVSLDEPGAMEESRAIKLDGENDYVKLTSFGSTAVLPGPCAQNLYGYSMEMWVKFDFPASGREALFSSDNVKSGFYVYRSEDGRLNFTVDKFSGESPTTHTDEPVSTGEWHHVVATAQYYHYCEGESGPWAPPQMKLYVDDFAYPLYFEEGYYPLTVGLGGYDLIGAKSSGSGLTDWLNATVDDVAIYRGHPLDEGEALAHMAIGEVADPSALLVPPVDPEDGDADEDGVLDSVDNCPEVANAGQDDADGDGVGDACQEEPDSDGDEVPDETDNCPEVANKEQIDSDENGVGDACEP